MRIDQLKICINDFENIDFNNLLEKSKTKTCLAFTEIFNNETVKYEENSKEWKVFSLLAAVTNFCLNSDENGDAFIPFSIFKNSRTIIHQDLNEEQLEVLSILLPDIKVPELKARIADVLWERRFGDVSYIFAEKAIEEYLLSAEEILKVGKEKIFALERIRRSISLARIIRYKKQNDAFMKIQSFVEDLDLENIIFIRIIEMLLQNNFHPNKKFLEKAKKKYEKYIEDRDYVTAERYCELIVDWYRLLKDDDLKRSAQIDLANILILRAEQNVESGNYIAATLFLKEAILAFNNIEGTEIEREKLRKKLLNYQSKLSNNLSSVEISINLEDYANRAKARIMGKSKEDAIIELAFIDGIPNKEYIRKQTERTQSPLLTFISREIINENGRTIATNSPSINTSEEEKEKSLEEDMFSYVSNYERGVRVEGIIKPSLYQLNFEHNIYETDLDFIVKDNPFIPKDRRLLFRRGLYAGFKSDYVISTHILGLQIENSIRYVLNNEGVITTSLNTEGIQEEIDLNRLLDFKELIPIFGEDLIFDLKGLLISRFGDNLRNRIAHGLLSSNNFFSQSVIYLWWLMLKICAFPLYRENKSKE